MTEISVKTKLWSLIVIMLLFIIGVGAVGFVTLNTEAAAFKELDDLDNAFLNLTDQVAFKIIQLRRFEKDYFLNIGNPARQQEYLKKYQEIDATVPQLISKLTDLARSDEHLVKDLKAKVAALAGPYGDYREGFYATVQRLKSDPNLTPQQANLLMTQYKASIPVLEETTAAVVQAGNEVAERVAAQAMQRGRNARMLIVVAVLIAVVLAGVLGSALCHSIYRAIFREGLRRMAHRI
ncbi:MAG: MCP four helix bundle domain-containing protein [Desulfobaccales bacterium]